MQIFASDAHRAHAPAQEFFEGRLIPYQESPNRVDMIRSALGGLGAVLAPADFGLAPIRAVHTPAYLAWLQALYPAWVAAGGAETGAVCDTFRMPGLPTAAHAPKAAMGQFMIDATSVVQAGTWAAAVASAHCALAAASAVNNGAGLAYALCRPPGHHAHSALTGGYCFLNNAAIAAQWLRDHGHARVTVLDVDFHHGNGTQDIFYARADVQFVSIHADPERHYPYFAGRAEERGVGDGVGFTHNHPLAARTDDAAYLRVLETACGAVGAFAPSALVVSLGVDTFDGDPLGDFALTRAGFEAIGARIGRLGLPTVFVQEGGYAIAELGYNVAAVLQGAAGAR